MAYNSVCPSSQMNVSEIVQILRQDVCLYFIWTSPYQRVDRIEHLSSFRVECVILFSINNAKVSIRRLYSAMMQVKDVITY